MPKEAKKSKDEESSKGESKAKSEKAAPKPKKPSDYSRKTHLDNAQAMHGVSMPMVAGAIAVIRQDDPQKDRFTKEEVAKAIKNYAKQQ